MQVLTNHQPTGNDMDSEEDEKSLRFQSVAVLRSHFEAFNRGDLQTARNQCFFPSGMNQNPLDAYVASMAALVPFTDIELEDTYFEPVRMKRHGRVATTWVRARVSFQGARHEFEFNIWWFPSSATFMVSARPIDWGGKGLTNRSLQ